MKEINITMPIVGVREASISELVRIEIKGLLFFIRMNP